MQIGSTAGSGDGPVVAASTRSSSAIAAGTPLFSCRWVGRSVGGWVGGRIEWVGWWVGGCPVVRYGGTVVREYGR